MRSPRVQHDWSDLAPKVRIPHLGTVIVYEDIIFFEESAFFCRFFLTLSRLLTSQDCSCKGVARIPNRTISQLTCLWWATHAAHPYSDNGSSFQPAQPPTCSDFTGIHFSCLFFFLGAPPGSRKVTQKSSPFAFSHSAVKQGWARNGRVWQEPAQDRERSLLTTHPWQRGQCPRKVKGPLSRPEDELSCWQVKMLWNKMSYTIEIYLLTQTLDRQGRPKKVLSSERCPRPPSAQQHRLPTRCVPGSLPLSEIFATP